MNLFWTQIHPGLLFSHLPVGDKQNTLGITASEEQEKPLKVPQGSRITTHLPVTFLESARLKGHGKGAN